MDQEINSMQPAIPPGNLPLPQLVYWSADLAQEPGIYINSLEGEFVPWAKLKIEVEQQIIPKIAHLPPGSSAITAKHGERENFVVRIVSPQDEQIGSVWFGSDPYKNWVQDGLVRIGRSIHAGAPETVVWFVIQRYSDGSYRTLAAYI